jgi:hypothetical protein
MPTKKYTEKELEILSAVKESGIINFDQVGKLISKVGPSLFDSGLAAADYVVTAVNSVLRVWSWDTMPNLGEITELKEMIGEVKK